MADLIDPGGVPLVDTATNQIVAVPHDQAQLALTGGTHNLAVGTQVNVVNPDGQLVSLPSEQIPDAISSGYKLPGQAAVTEYNNQQQYGEGLGPEAKAAAASAARMGTFGLSDLALTKTGLVNPDTLKQLEERNPASNIAGGGLGLAAGLLGPEEISAVGKVAQYGLRTTEVARPVAARIAASLANPETSPLVAKILASTGEVAAKTLGSAVEGSVYGLGNAVTEYALGDSDLNAENILHNVGYGALFGGGLGGLLGTASETYAGAKSIFGKDIAQAGARDAITENAALNPTPQVLNPPTSLEEIAKHLENAAKDGYATELPAQGRLLETNEILAGDSEFPAHSLQVQSLSSPIMRDGYKAALENPANADGQLLRTWESVQKDEGANKLLPKFIQDISPGTKPIADAVEGGEKAVKMFTDQYKAEQAELKPLFNKFNDVAVESLDQPHDLLKAIDVAIPEASKAIYADADGIRHILPYKPTMGFTEDAHKAISDLLDVFNKPETTIGEVRNLRESFRDKVNFLSSPRTSAEISGLRRELMNVVQNRIDQLAPDLNTREVFKRYAQNEESRTIMEQIMGGSINDKASFAREIKPEEVLNRLFGNTVYVKAAKDILGKDFDKLSAHYIAQKVAGVTDAAKNGFSSNKFATFLKQKGPELEEALAQHPDQLNKIRAITDKMRILPDSPSINPSGTAKTTLLQKMQGFGGMLTPEGLLAIPGRVISAAGEHFEQMQQHSEFNRILRSNTNMGSEQQLLKKTNQYGAYSKIERMLNTTVRAISKGAAALFTGAEKSTGAIAQKMIPHEENIKKYQKLESHLKDMGSDVDLFTNTLQKATQALHEIAPDMNSSLTMAAVRATQFLQSKLPAQNPSSPLTKPYEPSKSELAKFNRYVDIVENPLKVLKQLQAGDLTTESLETLQTVYPKLLTQMQNAVHSNLNEKNLNKMTYQHKIMASAFLGTDLSNSLSQPNILSAQIQGAQPQPPPQTRPKNRVGPSQKGLSKLDQSTAYKTPQQQALARTER